MSETDVMAVRSPSRSPVVDPRVERSRELVLAATLDLLAEVGYGELTIEAVSARSGVAKSTVYRHWPGKLELVTEAFDTLCTASDIDVTAGPLRDRLVAYLTAATTVPQDEDKRAACMPALIEAAQHCPEVADASRRLAEMRNAPIVAMLRQGVEDGELPADVDVETLCDSLVGPIVLRRLFHRRPFHPDDVPALVDQVLPPPSPR
jgi:TetR/AcrR family transcriptional regulator, regulator of autoinduction and epiphytic fitness